MLLRCKMGNSEKCLKCGSNLCEMKTMTLPTKDPNSSKIINLDMFYLKICKDCGYTEMYSAKIIEKAKKPIQNY